MDGSILAAEGRLAEILDREVAFYEQFVPNKKILAEYLFNTKVRLLDMIESAFDTKIQALVGDEEFDVELDEVPS